MTCLKHLSQLSLLHGFAGAVGRMLSPSERISLSLNLPTYCDTLLQCANITKFGWSAQKIGGKMIIL